MKRIILKERPGWQQRVEQLGFSFHSDGGSYWTDDIAYAFSMDEIEQIEDAANNIETMVMSVVDSAVNNREVLTSLAIPADYHALVRHSWQHQEKNVFCRYDLSYDGKNPPKLLEANADTPTSLPEAAVIQWAWLEDQIAAGELPAGSDQFNSLHEKLVNAWKRMNINGTLTLAGILDLPEDYVNLLYMTDCASQAGIECHLMDIDQIGMLSDGMFCDDNSMPVRNLFKLHPWEHLVRSGYGSSLLDNRDRLRVIEPAWKMVVSNKGLLPLLWEAFPYHPNLLGASFGSAESECSGWIRSGQPVVRKPLLSREGANIEVIGKPVRTDGPYGAEGHVLQEFAPLPDHGGHHPVIGAWTIAGQAAGMGIRESDTLITTNTSRFIPHYIVPEGSHQPT